MPQPENATILISTTFLLSPDRGTRGTQNAKLLKRCYQTLSVSIQGKKGSEKKSQLNITGRHQPPITAHGDSVSIIL